MLFKKNLTIDANTTEESPAREVLELIKGLIYKVEFRFPPGCAALAHLAVLYQEDWVWPSVPNTYIEDDAINIVSDEIFELETEPADLILLGWNEDTVFDHTIYCRFWLTDKDLYKARFLPMTAYNLQKEIEAKEKELIKEEPQQIELILPFAIREKL